MQSFPQASTKILLQQFQVKVVGKEGSVELVWFGAEVPQGLCEVLLLLYPVAFTRWRFQRKL